MLPSHDKGAVSGSNSKFEFEPQVPLLPPDLGVERGASHLRVISQFLLIRREGVFEGVFACSQVKLNRMGQAVQTACRV